jgi:hypothetical protein
LEAEENCTIRKHIMFTPFRTLSLPNQREWDYWGMQHTWETDNSGTDA